MKDLTEGSFEPSAAARDARNGLFLVGGYLTGLIMLGQGSPSTLRVWPMRQTVLFTASPFQHSAAAMVLFGLVEPAPGQFRQNGNRKDGR